MALARLVWLSLRYGGPVYTAHVLRGEWQIPGSLWFLLTHS
jgi:hypothetical protein